MIFHEYNVDTRLLIGASDIQNLVVFVTAECENVIYFNFVIVNNPFNIPDSLQDIVTCGYGGEHGVLNAINLFVVLVIKLLNVTLGANFVNKPEPLILLLLVWVHKTNSIPVVNEEVLILVTACFALNAELLNMDNWIFMFIKRKFLAENLSFSVHFFYLLQLIGLFIFDIFLLIGEMDMVLFSDCYKQDFVVLIPLIPLTFFLVLIFVTVRFYKQMIKLEYHLSLHFFWIVDY